ncbi:MAG: hypothetical protein R2862_06560 [Thermoanaerobaculia bacterium]
MAGDGGSDGTTDDWPVAPAAVYGLEQPLRCPSCEQSIDQIVVVRLFRARVNFMSSLPRSLAPRLPTLPDDPSRRARRRLLETVAPPAQRGGGPSSWKRMASRVVIGTATPSRVPGS